MEAVQEANEEVPVKITPGELQRWSDRRMVARMLESGTEIAEIVKFMAAYRARSWVYKICNRIKQNPDDLVAHPRAGRPKKLTRSMKRTIDRNLQKHNKKSNKTPQQLAEQFKLSSEFHDGVVPVSRYVVHHVKCAPLFSVR